MTPLRPTPIALAAVALTQPLAAAPLAPVEEQIAGRGSCFPETVARTS